MCVCALVIVLFSFRLIRPCWCGVDHLVNNNNNNNEKNSYTAHWHFMLSSQLCEVVVAFHSTETEQFQLLLHTLHIILPAHTRIHTCGWRACTYIHIRGCMCVHTVHTSISTAVYHPPTNLSLFGYVCTCCCCCSYFFYWLWNMLRFTSHCHSQLMCWKAPFKPFLFCFSLHQMTSFWLLLVRWWLFSLLFVFQNAKMINRTLWKINQCGNVLSSLNEVSTYWSEMKKKQT